MSMAASIVMVMAVAMPAMGVLRGSRLGRQAVDAQGKNSGQGDFHDPHCLFSHCARHSFAGRAPIEAHDSGLAGDSAFSCEIGSKSADRAGSAWLTKL